nr:hypothetical protein [Tanacetum cinerariifolium]
AGDNSSAMSGCRVRRIKATGENRSSVDTNDVTQVTVDKITRKNFAMKSIESTLNNSEETEPAFFNAASNGHLSSSSIDPVEDELDNLLQYEESRSHLL